MPTKPTAAPPAPAPSPAANGYDEAAPIADPLAEIEHAAAVTPNARVRVFRSDERGNSAYVADIEGADFSAAMLQRPPFNGGRFQVQVRDASTGQYLKSCRVSVAPLPRPGPTFATPAAAPAYEPAYGSGPAESSAVVGALERLNARLERMERAQQSQPTNAGVLGGLTIADILALAEKKNAGMSAADFAAIAGVFRRDASPLAEQIEAMKALKMLAGEAAEEAAPADPLGPLVTALATKIIEAMQAKPTEPQRRPRIAPALRLTHAPDPRHAAPAPGAHSPASAERPGQAAQQQQQQQPSGIIPADKRPALCAFLSLCASAPNRDADATADMIAKQMPGPAWDALRTIPPGALTDEIIRAEATLMPHLGFLDAVEIALRDMQAQADAEADAGANNAADVPGQQPLATPEGVPLVHIDHTPPPAAAPKRRREAREAKK